MSQKSQTRKMWLRNMMLVLGCELLFTISALSQNPLDFVPSPEATSVIRGIQNSVNHYYGTLNVQVPIFTIEEGDIQVPIFLSYQASGIRVQDIATSVGLGWKLSAGGVITKIVKGHPDNSDNGYYNIYQEMNNVSSWNQSNYDHAVENNYDGEPDLYYYEVCGRSGIFVLDHNKKAYCIPYSNQKIIFDDTKSHFTIIDECGNKFLFQNVDGQISTKPGSGQREPRTASSWHLTRIESYSGAYVKFSYQEYTQKFTNYSFVSKVTMTGTSFGGFTDETDISIHNTIYGNHIKKIEWSTGSLEFTTDSERTDVSDGLRLNEIKYQNIQGFISRFCLNYEKTYHSFLLKSIDRFDSSNNKNTYVKFGYYNAVNLPARNSKDYDHWGFYNGAKNTSNFSFTYANVDYGAKRTPSLNHTKANVLINMESETGSISEFNYELHEAVHVITDEFGYLDTLGNFAVGGLRIKSVTETNGTSSSTTSFRYTKDSKGSLPLFYISTGREQIQRKSYGKLAYNYVYPYTVYDVFSFLNSNYLDVSGSYITYREVKEINQNGSYTVRKFSDDKDIDHRATIIGGTQKLNDDFLPKTSQFYKRGLLLEEASYDANGNLISTKEYTYKLDDENKKEVRGIYLDRIAHNKVYSFYNWTSQPVQLEKIIEKGLYSPRKEISFTYDRKYSMPVKTTHKDVEGNTTTEQVSYWFDYPQTKQPNTKNQSYVYWLMKEHNIFVPIETISTHNERITGASLNQYTVYQKFSNFQSKPIVTLHKIYDLKTPSSLSPTSFSAAEAVSESAEMKKDSRYECVVENDQWDPRGFPISGISNNFKDRKSIIYYGDTFIPIAEVDNATYSLPTTVSSPLEDKYTYYDAWGATRIYIPSNQEIEVEFGFSSDYTSPSGIRTTQVLVSTSPSISQYVYQQFGTDSFKILVEPGEYYIEVVYRDSSTNEKKPVRILTGSGHLKIKYSEHQTVYGRTSTVFHTSFEDLITATTTPKAKTGSKVYSHSYNIDMKNIASGDYILSWWRSFDNGESWEKVERSITHTTASSITVPLEGANYIDEVRLMPAYARMKTYTPLPSVGITSEMDHNGVVKYYEYDSFGRLSRELDQDRNVLVEYEYNIGQ